MHEGLWTEVEPPRGGHEREALDFVRRRLPGREPWRAWSNFTFVEPSGRTAEVDLLVVAPRGVFLVEIKSYPDGELEGDASTWRWRPAKGGGRSYDNPFLLADLKAKRLKSLLLAQRALRTGDAPRAAAKLWVQAVVFLSSPHLRVSLSQRGRASVFGPDPDPGSPAEEQANRLPGLLAHLKGLDAERGAQVDRPLSAALARAMEQADIRRSQRYLTAGSYQLVELLDEGDTWQDYRATHRASRVDKRARIHLRSRAADDDERAAIDRAAEREFRLLSRLQHPGIERPEALEPNPRGLATLYPYDPEAVRLDHWLETYPDADLLTRLGLVRAIAETLAHAHEHGLAHRALTPRQVWLSDPEGTPLPRLRGWSALARDVTTTATTGTGAGRDGTRHPGHLRLLAGSEAEPYLAPELRTVPEASGRLADVFALGGLTHLVLTGQPPAADGDALLRLLDEHGHVPLAATMDAPPAVLVDVVSGATAADIGERFPSVTEFLAWLELAEEDLTAPEEVDLLTAGRGAQVGPWTILGRLGSGATSVVLLAERAGKTEVLKVARDADHAERLRAEYEVLDGLRHPAIIAVRGFEQLGAHAVLRLQPGLTRGKGEARVADTLAARLQEHGPPTIDLLQRWGNDLLDALVELEHEGVEHRDLKPENLVFVERGKDRATHLALIDFSLSRAPKTDLDAGTIGYLDPFLRDRDERRWDLHAERYAAAVVLTEIATGERPSWGGGDPRSTDLDVPDIRADVIDPAVREPLVAFLHRALHRDVKQRFDTADDMRRAWERVFSRVDETSGHATGLSADELDLSELTPATPIGELGLAPRLVGAIERLGVADVGGLARVQRGVTIAGVGAAVRRELRHLIGRLRDAGLAEEPDTLEELAPGDVARLSVDRMAERLVPRSNLSEAQRRMLTVLLGLHADTGQRWPTIASTAEVTGGERSVVTDELERARKRWAQYRPELRAVREEFAAWLASRGGVATGQELAAVLLARRGSSVEDEEHRYRRSRAVVRACVEAEASIGQPRFRATRVGQQLIVALDRPGEVEGVGFVEWGADPLVEAAAALGERADELVAGGEVVGPDATVAALRGIGWPALPEGAGFDDVRLTQLAAAASTRAAVSSRGELYPRGMPAVRAAEAARLALIGRGGVTEQQVHERIRARFAQAEPPPPRPDLDRVLAEAGVGLEWDPEAGRYLLPEAVGSFSTLSRTSMTRYTDEADAAADADDLDRRLGRLRETGGFVAATVDPRSLDLAARTLAARIDAALVDLDAELLAAMDAAARSAGARWDVLLDADAQPRADQRFRALERLVGRAITALDERVRSAGRLVVAYDAGLLVRYGRLDLVERWREDLTRAEPPDGSVLRGLVLLVPGSDREQRPVLDGSPIPVATAGQWTRVPTSWLQKVPA